MQRLRALMYVSSLNLSAPEVAALSLARCSREVSRRVWVRSLASVRYVGSLVGRCRSGCVSAIARSVVSLSCALACIQVLTCLIN